MGTIIYKFSFPIHAITKDNFKGVTRYGRPYLSKEFKDFEHTLQCMFQSQKPKDFKRIETEDVFVGLSYFFKNRRHSDLFNLPKSTLDAFNGIIWKDDRQIKAGILRCEEYAPDDKIELEFWIKE